MMVDGAFERIFHVEETARRNDTACVVVMVTDLLHRLAWVQLHAIHLIGCFVRRVF